MSLLALLAAAAVALAGAKEDHYSSYEKLSRGEREGVDYRVTALKRESPYAVFAVHAGSIESATSEIARAFAGSDASLYLFEGIKPAGNQKLHLTSNHFDEPRALALARASTVCVSVHGFDEESRDAVCIGGASGKVREGLARALRGFETAFKLEIEQPCKRFRGASSRNVVNGCRKEGLQLELSSSLRRRLLADKSLLDRFAAVVRASLRETQESDIPVGRDSRSEGELGVPKSVQSESANDGAKDAPATGRREAR